MVWPLVQEGTSDRVGDQDMVTRREGLVSYVLLFHKNKSVHGKNIGNILNTEAYIRFCYLLYCPV